MGILRVTGRLVCENEAQAEKLRAHVDEHVRLSRAEPGNIHFDITPTEDPLVWSVSESFHSRAAFEDHQTRTAASRWARESAGIARDMSVHEEQA